MALNSRFWRTTPFQLTVLHGLVFAVAVMALLGLIYARTAGYMTRQIDAIVLSEAHALAKPGPDGLPDRVQAAVKADERAIAYYALFSADGVWIAGNVRALPAGMIPDGKPRVLKGPAFLPGARAVVLRLPWGEQLFVGHDAKVLSGLREIIVEALLVSGALILGLGLIAAAALSAQPLRRIESLRVASQAALSGAVGVRLPVSPRRDEIDMLANLANAMMDESERLLWEVKSVGDNIAHDLRTPLNRLRALLYRVSQETSLAPTDAAMIEQALAETDALLSRFRALLRIGEIERCDRRAGVKPVRLQEVLAHAGELYEPLAEDRGVAFSIALDPDAPMVEADADLLFEAVGNLIDNALKFTPPGGTVRVRLITLAQGPRLEVADDGPGVDPQERDAVLNRFHRGRRTLDTPGSGLGLSIVAAVARLHQFTLTLSDAKPGLVVSLDCWPRRLEA
ncbi:HAMP domain-containing sensor histidine kinase [Caulobacter sp. SSI4214]|uniref:sensor histidine kinase n=1 Tax=Caulobacter sp. SSI4214 TaxID=2575739 RepID=UPI001438EB53|nr:HAMP domain-containing sensor histidine kinase [Caulobacter sp. SSI4214]